MSRRVCLVGPATSVHLQRWARALLERDLQVSILSTVPLAGPLLDMPRQLSVLTIPTAVGGMSPYRRLSILLRGWARVASIVAASRPDVVHIHSLPAPAAVPFLRRLPGLIVTPWGSDIVQDDQRKRRLYPYLLARAERLTTASHYLARVVENYLPAPRTIDVVPFGVDPDQFRPAPLPADELRIGSLRHLEPVYGLDILMEAVARLGEAGAHATLHIAGSGSQHSALLAQARRLGLLGRINLLGRVAHAAAPAFLQSLSVYANPSRSESFGVAALEAQACAIPVVATNVGGLPEVVRDGETGLLVPPEEPGKLAEALLTLIRDPERRVRMGHAGRAWVLERYCWQAGVEQMLQIYEHVACAAS